MGARGDRRPDARLLRVPPPPLPRALRRRRTTAGSRTRSRAYQRLRREVLEAQRDEIIWLRNEGIINDEVMRRIERDLDLEDARWRSPRGRSRWSRGSVAAAAGVYWGLGRGIGRAARLLLAVRA